MNMVERANLAQPTPPAAVNQERVNLAVSLRIFWCALRVRPVEAIAGIFWYARGKRLRARNRIRAAAATSAAYYRLWTRNVEPRLQARVSGGPPVPIDASVFAVILNADVCSARTDTTRRSLVEAFGDWIRFENPDVDAHGLLGSKDPAWLLVIEAGDRISPHAGTVLAGQIAGSPAAEILFWDEDKDTPQGRAAPWVKHEWDPLIFLARDGVTGAALIRVDAADLDLAQGDIATRRQLVTAVARSSARGAIVHVAHILTHRASKARATPVDRAALLRELWPDPATFLVGATKEELVVQWPMASWPSVSIVIPTRDRVDLLRPCLESLEQLTYPGRVEILIADNDSVEPKTLAYFKDMEAAGVRVVSCPGAFNFATINNRAVDAATGDLICLLNNDIEALDGAWLEAMARHAARREVGCVGALLLYPDGTVQHAGVALGVGGAAGHVYRNAAPEAWENGALHRTTRRVSVVTAACLLVRRDLYRDVGGLDADAFAVAFNDVDFCLRVQERGLANVFVAEARLIHHESKSRGDDMLKVNVVRYSRELNQLQRRWGTVSGVDRWHSPRIRRAGEAFVLDIA